MTTTFNPALATVRDRIRQRIGDTNVADALFQDETISAYTADQGMGEMEAAIRLVRDLIARFSREVDQDIDGQGEKASQRVKSYKVLLSDLQAEANTAAASTSTGFGGLKVTGLNDPCGWDPYSV